MSYGAVLNPVLHDKKLDLPDDLGELIDHIAVANRKVESLTAVECAKEVAKALSARAVTKDITSKPHLLNIVDKIVRDYYGDEPKAQSLEIIIEPRPIAPIERSPVDRTFTNPNSPGEGFTMWQLAQIWGCTQQTVSNRMKKFRDDVFILYGQGAKRPDADPRGAKPDLYFLRSDFPSAEEIVGSMEPDSIYTTSTVAAMFSGSYPGTDSRIYACLMRELDVNGDGLCLVDIITTNKENRYRIATHGHGPDSKAEADC